MLIIFSKVVVQFDKQFILTNGKNATLFEDFVQKAQSQGRILFPEKMKERMPAENPGKDIKGHERYNTSVTAFGNIKLADDALSKADSNLPAFPSSSLIPEDKE